MSWNRQLFILDRNNEDREELKRLVAKRNAQLKANGVKWDTIITDDEMRSRKELNLSCDGYITLTNFKKKVLLENKDFILNRKTLTQELADEELAKQFEKQIEISSLQPKKTC